MTMIFSFSFLVWAKFLICMVLCSFYPTGSSMCDLVLNLHPTIFLCPTIMCLVIILSVLVNVFGISLSHTLLVEVPLLWKFFGVVVLRNERYFIPPSILCILFLLSHFPVVVGIWGDHGYLQHKKIYFYNFKCWEMGS